MTYNFPFPDISGVRVKPTNMQPLANMADYDRPPTDEQPKQDPLQDYIKRVIHDGLQDENDV